MKLLLFLLTVVCNLCAFSQSVRSLSGSVLTTGNAMTVQGDRYASSKSTPSLDGRSYWVEQSYGLVKFYIKPSAVLGVRSNATAQVTFNIGYEVEKNGSFQTGTPSYNSITLSLSIMDNQVSDVAYFKVDDAQKLTVTITSVSPASLSDNYVLEASVVTNSFTKLGLSDIPTLNVATRTTDKNLKVSWSDMSAKGATAYDFEWSYISDYDELGQRQPLSSLQLDRMVFKNNSSRIQTAQTYYEIPLMYERGVLLYRVRAVGKNVVNNTPYTAYSKWSTDDELNLTNFQQFTDPNSYTQISGLDTNMNWQSSLSFAEEGKTKLVMNYMDGSLRSRQEQTRNNSDQRLVIGETLYDYNGKDVISMLPVPITKNDLGYRPHFNVTNGKTFLSKSEYVGTYAGNSCTILSPGFDSNSGSSSYFSLSNQFGTNGNTGSNMLNRNLLPYDSLFPYTQKVYTNDHSGRIAKSTIPGANYRMKTGHETSFYYGNAQQTELSRLFGAQVGYSQNYKKNITVDPNGQSTLQYLNLQGKVIASALTGKDPDNLKSIPGFSATEKNDLLKGAGANDVIINDGKVKSYVAKIVVDSKKPYKVTYNGTFGSYKIVCNDITGADIGYPVDGAVKVQLNLLNNCNQQLLNSSGSTVGGNTGQSQTVSLAPTIGTDGQLEPGEYQLTRTVTVDDDKLEEYWQAYSATRCIKSVDEFKSKELSYVNTVGCNFSSCAQCTTEIEKMIAAHQDFNSKEINYLRNICSDLCNPKSTCSMALEGLLSDVSPDGQYGEIRKQNLNMNTTPTITYDANNKPSANNEASLEIVNNTEGTGAGNDIKPSDFPLSVFNTGNVLPNQFFRNQKCTWHYPVKIVSSNYTNYVNNEFLFNEKFVPSKSNLSYALTDYTDTDGNIFYVEVTFKSLTVNASSSPKVDWGLLGPQINNTNIVVPVDTRNGKYKIPVRYLAEFKDFYANWQKHWANFLVVYHPEFKYFLQCKEEGASNRFTDLLMTSNKVVDAKSAGLLNASNVPLIIGATPETSLDSLIKTNGLNHKFMSMVANDYKAGNNGSSSPSTKYSMAQIATMAVGCPEDNKCGADPNCKDGILDRDDEWQLYRTFYLAEKQKLLALNNNQLSLTNGYYCGCIGNPNAWSDPNLYKKRNVNYFYGNPGFSYTYSVMVDNGMCNRNTIGHFMKKTKRFYPENSLTINGNTVAKRCTTVVTVDTPTKDTLFMSTPCEEDITAQMNELNQERDRAKYESCGLCPLASDLEQLFMDLRSNKMLKNVSDVALTCNPSAKDNTGQLLYPISLGVALGKYIKDASGGIDQAVYWKASVSGKLLTGNLYSGSTNFFTLNLRIPDNVNANFNSLFKLCCMTVPDSYAGALSFEQGKSFVLKSSYLDINTDEVSFFMEGKSSIAISPCTIPPRCILSNDAKNVISLLNALILTDDQGKADDLTRSSVSLSSSERKDYYNSAVFNVLKINSSSVSDLSVLQPKWTGTVITDASNNKTLKGVFSTVQNSVTNNIAIDITGLLPTYRYEDVVSFVNLRQESSPPTNATCPYPACAMKTFVADAVLAHPQIKGTYLYVPVKVNVPALNPVACKYPIPASNVVK